MENISYDNPCNSNKDCDSNACELIYENNKPKGRYCLMDTNNVYTIKCRSNKDCKSGSCKPIYDNNDKFVTRKCVQAPKIDRDTAYNALFGSDRNNDYGLINSDTIAIQAGNRGPITEIIIKLFSIFGNLFNILIFNTDVCRTSTNPECNSIIERRNQGLLYGIFLDIFGLVWGVTVGKIEKTFKSKTTYKCESNKKGINLWYIRTILTILFPPLGVFMSFGLNGIGKIITCCILTMCFYFPGLIYALVIINTTKAEEDDSEIMKEYKSLQKLS